MLKRVHHVKESCIFSDEINTNVQTGKAVETGSGFTHHANGTKLVLQTMNSTVATTTHRVATRCRGSRGSRGVRSANGRPP